MDQLVRSPITLPFVALACTLRLISETDMENFWNTGSTPLSERHRNRTNWATIQAILEAQLRAAYVRSSAEAGEFQRPGPLQREQGAAFAAAVIRGARDWELQRPKGYELARTITGLLTHVTWLELLGVVGDLAGSGLDAVGDALGGHAVPFADAIDQPASLFDLDAMLHGHPHDDALGAIHHAPAAEAFGMPLVVDGDPRVHPVHGYVRSDGAFVHAYWRGDRG